MGRLLRLEPKFDHKRQKWVVSVPPHLSPTGKRKRLYWDRGKEDQASEHARRLREGNDHFRSRAKGIKPELMETAIKWDDLVREMGFLGLEHFCSVKMEEMKHHAASPKLSKLLDTFESDHRKNWSPQYYGKRWKPFRNRLLDVEDMTISHMDEAFWREWLAGWKKQDKPGVVTYNQQMGMIRSMFELAAGKKVFPINPLDDLPGAKEKGRRRKPVSTPEEVKRLLETAWEHDRDMVPYFATCYFAGPRPDSEAKRIRFEHYNWKTDQLKIGVTKTDFDPERYVEIDEALRKWMEPWMRKKGSIIPDNFAKRRRRLIYGYHTTPGATIGDESKWKQLVPWGHDITRHTYGSQFEAAHRTEAGCRERLAANMGHVDFKTFRREYQNARSPEEAREFWALRPPAQESKVIKIA